MRTKLEVEVIHVETNFAVVKMPGRAFAGIVIQGDSLAALLEMVNEARENFASDPDESKEALTNLYDEIKWRVDALNATLGRMKV